MKYTDIRAKFFASAPEQVIFVAVERLENVAGYMCYYAVARDPKEPRIIYQWRRDYVDYERLAKTEDGKFFWDTQPKKFDLGRNTEPDEVLLWIQKQHGKFEALERLLEDYGLGAAFNDLCFEVFGWEREQGVFTILPEEIEKRSMLAHDFLKERLVKK